MPARFRSRNRGPWGAPAGRPWQAFLIDIFRAAAGDVAGEDGDADGLADEPAAAVSEDDIHAGGVKRVWLVVVCAVHHAGAGASKPALRERVQRQIAGRIGPGRAGDAA